MKAKRILSIAAAMIVATIAANAQNRRTDNPGTVYLLPGYMCHHGGNFYVDGIMVPEQELIHYFGDFNYKETYEGARKQRKAGNILISIGVPMTVIGLVTALACEDDGIYTVGTAGAIIGAACVDVGIPLLAVGNGRMNWLAEDYNYYANRYMGYRKPTLNLTGSRHGAGLGLALRF